MGLEIRQGPDHAGPWAEKAAMLVFVLNTMGGSADMFQVG